MKRVLGSILCLAGLSACVSFRWERDVRHHAANADQIAAISVGTATLTDCLRLLGAPLFVEEYAEGMALYWGWTRQSEFGLSVDVPLGKSASASVSYADQDLARKGILVVLDRELRVELLRQGLLADLVSTLARRRPQVVDSEVEQ